LDSIDTRNHQKIYGSSCHEVASSQPHAQECASGSDKRCDLIKVLKNLSDANGADQWSFCTNNPAEKSFFAFSLKLPGKFPGELNVQTSAEPSKFVLCLHESEFEGSMKAKFTIAGQDLEYLGTDQYGSWYSFLNPEILTTILVRPDGNLCDTVVKTVDTFRRERCRRLKESNT
jgi:hypothetical protein